MQEPCKRFQSCQRECAPDLRVEYPVAVVEQCVHIIDCALMVPGGEPSGGQQPLHAFPVEGTGASLKVEQCAARGVDRWFTDCRNGGGLDGVNFVNEPFNLCEPLNQFSVFFGCLFFAIFAEIADEVDLVPQLASRELFGDF